MVKIDDTQEPSRQMVLYDDGAGHPIVEVTLLDRDVWLTQAQIAQLYEKKVPTINSHILNVIQEGEVDAEATIRNFLIVQKEGIRPVDRSMAGKATLGRASPIGV